MWTIDRRGAGSGLALAAAAAALCLALACAPAPDKNAPPPRKGQPAGKLTGDVTYLQRVALPAGAVVTVTLDDVSLADAPAERVATVTIVTQGENVPLPFSLNYDPSTIKADHAYALSAQIHVDGRLAWATATAQPVLTNGNPAADVHLTAQPSGGS